MNNQPQFRVKMIFKDGSFRYINHVRESNGFTKILLGGKPLLFEKFGTATVYGQIKRNMHNDLIADFEVETI